MLHRHHFYNVKIFLLTLLFPLTLYYFFYNCVELKDFIFYKNNNYFLFSIYLSGILLIIPLFILTNSRIKKKNTIWFFFGSFIPLVYLFITTNNSLVFFIVYEMFLVPSYFIVKFYSPNRRSIYVSNYFLLWVFELLELMSSYWILSTLLLTYWA